MAKRKTKVGIIGTGNIGSDLLVKVMRSDILECGIFTGQNLNSEGIKRAKALGVNTSFKSIAAIEENPELCEIVFDATSAQFHKIHAPILKKLGKFTIDMTPSRIGQMCIPFVNLQESLNKKNVNMVTCGGQSTIPIIWSIKQLYPKLEYVEVVSSISSKSAGIGTRNNIDEYTQTTAEGISMFADIPHAKAIIILNPAEPPILMHNTIYLKITDPDIKLLNKQVNSIVKKIKEYVPGFKVVLPPTYENERVTIMIEVSGRGDYLPVFAGNLDIINCAAIVVAEEFAKRRLRS